MATSDCLSDTLELIHRHTIDVHNPGTVRVEIAKIICRHGWQRAITAGKNASASWGNMEPILLAQALQRKRALANH